MVVDEFNRAADAATKDRKLEAVNNAVQLLLVLTEIDYCVKLMKE